MDCLELRKNLLLYVDNELSAEEAGEIRQHLEICNGCRRRVGYEERFKAMLREKLTSQSAPPGLREAIVARLTRESVAGRGHFGRVRNSRPALALAGAGLLALLIVAPFLANRMLSRSSDGRAAHLRGRLVCIQCERSGVRIADQRRCHAAGHVTGLKSESGEILALSDTDSVAPLVSDPSLRGREVEVEGTLYHRISTLEVRSATLR